MTKLRKTILSIALVSITTQVVMVEAFADSKNFAALAVSPNSKSGTINGREFDGAPILEFYIGRKKMFFNTIGLYGNYGMTVYEADLDGYSDEIAYTYSIFNLGLTYSLGDRFTLMTGIGKSKERAEFMYANKVYQSKASKTKTNYNLEAMYRIGKSVGIIAGYNSAPGAYNIGMSFEF